MDWSNRFTIVGFTVYYSTLHQMWEVITEKNGIEVSYRWFGMKAKAEAFAMNNLANGMKASTKAIKENKKARAKIANLMSAKVIQ